MDWEELVAPVVLTIFGVLLVYLCWFGWTHVCVRSHHELVYDPPTYYVDGNGMTQLMDAGGTRDRVICDEWKRR